MTTGPSSSSAELAEYPVGFDDGCCRAYYPERGMMLSVGAVVVLRRA